MILERLTMVVASANAGRCMSPRWGMVDTDITLSSGGSRTQPTVRRYQHGSCASLISQGAEVEDTSTVPSSLVHVDIALGNVAYLCLVLPTIIT
jgi:hypothetical protein